MILVGSQRGGGQKLAVHLSRTDENEHMHVHEIRGFASETLSGALREIEAISRGTKCQQYLFSLSLNPPETESVSVDAIEDAADRIEKKLGLTGQARVMVFHEKEGRRHAHVVWSRIDVDTMTARNLPHFKYKLRDMSRDLFLENKWTMPRGLRVYGDRDPANFSLAEWQQAKRAGYDPRELKQSIQECWTRADTSAAFEQALKERGFFLARGDRRGFVVLDFQGEVHSLSRALNLKAKDVRARLGTPDALSDVAQTRRFIAGRMSHRLKEHVQQSQLSFKHKQATHEHNKLVVRDRHRAEREHLSDKHIERSRQEVQVRAERFRTGIKGLWDRVTGTHRKIRTQNEAEAKQCHARDRFEFQTLVDRQLSERRLLQSRIKADRNEQAKSLRSLRQDMGRYLRLEKPSLSDIEEPRVRRRRRSRGLKPD